MSKHAIRQIFINLLNVYAPGHGSSVGAEISIPKHLEFKAPM